MSYYKWRAELVEILTGIKNKKIMLDFLADLLTPAELNDVITRWQIIKQLNAGVHQRDIANNLKVSIAKITRGSRELLDKHGGFGQMLKLQKQKKI